MRVGDHVLGVIAEQVVGRPRHQHAGGEQPLLELAQPRFAAAIGVRDQRAHVHAALHRGRQRLLDLVAIEPEDEDVDLLAGGLDRLDDRHDAGLGLDDQFHGVYFGTLSFGFLVPLDRALAFRHRAP